MFQTWGRFRSFANGQRNGGFQRTGGSGRAARPGAPPRRRRRGTSAPSQTTRTRDDDEDPGQRAPAPRPCRGRPTGERRPPAVGSPSRSPSG